MGYRTHYTAAQYVVAGVYDADEANHLLDPEDPLTGPVVLIFDDAGNQERFVIEGNAEDFVAMADAVRRQVDG